MFTIQLWRGSFSFIFNSHFLSVVLEFFIFFIFIFISLDRCSIPSREGSILWSYLDITLLFSSYVYLIFYSIKGKFFGVGIFVSGVSTRSSILVQHERCNDFLTVTSLVSQKLSHPWLRWSQRTNDKTLSTFQSHIFILNLSPYKNRIIFIRK